MTSSACTTIAGAFTAARRGVARLRRECHAELSRARDERRTRRRDRQRRRSARPAAVAVMLSSGGLTRAPRVHVVDALPLASVAMPSLARRNRLPSQKSPSCRRHLLPPASVTCTVMDVGSAWVDCAGLPRAARGHDGRRNAGRDVERAAGSARESPRPLPTACSRRNSC